MRLLVITSCTSAKRVSHRRQLTYEDFARGPAWVSQREQELAAYLTPAHDLYAGLQHARLLRGIRALQAQAPAWQVDLWIVSAGYGLIPGSRPIAPYDCSFHLMPRRRARDWAAQIDLPRQVRTLLAEAYDLALILLGGLYLELCGVAAAVNFGGPTVALSGTKSAALLPVHPCPRVIMLGESETRRFSCGLVGLKGEVAARLLRYLADEGDLPSRLRDPAIQPFDLFDPRPQFA